VPALAINVNNAGFMGDHRKMRLHGISLDS
jgi:hypothetical protein